MNSTTFDYLLSPALLAKHLPLMAEAEVLSNLRCFLSLLQAEKSKNNQTPLPPPSVQPAGNEDQEVTETSSPPPALDAAVPHQAPSFRKQAVLQLMSLQLACRLDWNLTLLNQHVPIGLQHQLLDCLISACRLQKVLLELSIDTAEELTQEVVKDKSKVLALSLFGRWVLRSVVSLPLPLPLGSKVQIYASLPNATLPAVGNNDQQGPLHQWVVMQAPVALKVLQALTMCGHQMESVPEPSAFVLRDNAVMCSEVEGWKKIESGRWLSWALFDMALYHVGLEEYGLATKCLKTVSCLGCERVFECERDSSVLKGLTCALSAAGDKVANDPPPFQLTTPRDGEHMLRVLESDRKDIPYYWRVNYELISAFHQLAQASSIASSNILPRVSTSEPPNFESLRQLQLPDFAGANTKRKGAVVTILKDLATPREWSTKLTLTPRASVDVKSKSAKVKKRVALSAIFQETRATRLQKLSHDFQQQQKTILNARIVSSKWSLDDPILQAFSATLGRGEEADLAMLFLCKIAQLFKIGQCDEALGLFRSLESLVDKERSRSTQFKTLQCHVFSCHLGNVITHMLQATDEDMARCRQCIIDLRNFNLDLYEDILENCLATLVNKQDWDFLFSLQEQRWKALQVSQVVLSLAIFFKGGNLGLDVKKACAHLLDLLQLMGQQNVVGGKRSRDAAAAAKLSQIGIVRFFSKIRHPDYLQVLASFYSGLYNDAVEDAALRINHEFPPLAPNITALLLPQAVAGTGEHHLTVLRQLADQAGIMDAAWARLKGEVLFALGNHTSALKHFISTMVISSSYFLKVVPAGEREDKMIHKMIKCLVELGYHSYAVGMCQLLSDVDYSISFKNMEERHSNDGMDGIYDNIWDVTVLEYAVSMHAKRGEYARRRSALGKIGSLEINTNNNIEILRETASYKRFSFMRVLCLHFL